MRHLGVVFDTNMQMSDQVSAICRTVNFHLSNLWRIRRFIDKDTCAHAVRALIISRLDYCNSLLHRISKYDINRLQRLQNKAAKLVFALGRREHVTLYWKTCTGFVWKKESSSKFSCISTSACMARTHLTWREPWFFTHQDLQVFGRTLTPQGWLQQSMRLWW